MMSLAIAIAIWCATAGVNLQTGSDTAAEVDSGVHLQFVIWISSHAWGSLVEVAPAHGRVGWSRTLGESVVCTDAVRGGPGPARPNYTAWRSLKQALARSSRAMTRTLPARVIIMDHVIHES